MMISSKRYSKQKLSSTPNKLKDQSMDTPFQYFEKGDNKGYQNDDGNVFDTVEHHTNFNHESLIIDDPISHFDDA